MLSTSRKALTAVGRTTYPNADGSRPCAPSARTVLQTGKRTCCSQLYELTSSEQSGYEVRPNPPRRSIPLEQRRGITRPLRSAPNTSLWKKSHVLHLVGAPPRTHTKRRTKIAPVHQRAFKTLSPFRRLATRGTQPPNMAVQGQRNHTVFTHRCAPCQASMLS